MLRDSLFLDRASHPAQANIPADKAVREKVLLLARDYISKEKTAGPVSLAHLEQICDKIIEQSEISKQYKDFLSVLVNNEIWRDAVAAIPYDKRLLLLPKCLRDAENCKGHFDNVGLLCAHCGNCIIDRLQSDAEKLGYTVLIAEGSPIVISLIQTGQIECIIGASCLSVLEQTFKYMEAGAIPGIAIPLLYDGCKNTFLDIDWLSDAIYDSRAERNQRLNLRIICGQIKELFNEAQLKGLLVQENDPTEQIALDWMCCSGKRWRPAIMACTYAALSYRDFKFTDEVIQSAVAVECFHKASLIHDDIEDGDMQRYGKKTLNAEYNTGIALNVGDFLLGEGYRLLAELDVDSDRKNQMLSTAALGHRNLSLGQGRELLWSYEPGPLSVEDVLAIFEKKTAPAFEVALKTGAILAGQGGKYDDIFTQYSKYLGIAYQIQDDIDDYDKPCDSNDLLHNRPSIILALTYRAATAEQKNSIEQFWKNDPADQTVQQKIHEMIAAAHSRRTALEMLSLYKDKAVNSLTELKNQNLKGFFRIVVSKLFHEIEVMLCCDDDPKRND